MAFRKRATIKFGHKYYKLKVLGPSKTATLISVQSVKLKELPKTFLIYDTSYEGGRYDLKAGNYLLLLFCASNGIFTTIRSDYPEAKREYYLSKIGELFDVMIE